MASSSNSEFQAIYDIFLSFRGLDTRKKFTDHLYEALMREGFLTFRDNDEIERGENIKSELRKAIWNSMMSVIVLSRNYATSTSCLFEIQTIIEHRMENPDHFILPVFYEVDPGEIKEQAKKLVFGEEEVTVEEVERWSAALKEVASMAGMVSENQSNGYEARFIEEIIGVLCKQASKYLRVGDDPTINPPSNSDDDYSEDPNNDNSEDPDDDNSEDPDDDDNSEDTDDDDNSEDPDDDNSEHPGDDDNSEDPDDDSSEDPDDDYFEDSDEE